MIKVFLREKPISGGRISLYLDYWPPIKMPSGGETRRETLGMYIIANPRTAAEKLHNRQTKDIAETVKSQRQLDMQSGAYQLRQVNSDLLFTDFLDIQKEKRLNARTVNVWNLTKKKFIKAGLEKVTMGKFDIKTCIKYKDYLLHLVSEGKLKDITAHIYFSTFRTAVRTAYKEDMISVSLTEKFDGIKWVSGQRSYLLLEELNSLIATPISNTAIKNAAIFSALTGLRISDIRVLAWESIIDKDSGEAVLDYVIKKTGQRHILPIGIQARGILGERSTGTVFCGLPNASGICAMLARWTRRAGIEKHITFHCFRHTFATLQLSQGTSIMTVSAMLAHSDIKTTQIYAKVLDESKARAANRVVVKL